MTLSANLRVLAFLACCAAPGAAQSFAYSQPPIPLQQTRIVGRPESAVGFYQPVICDGSGNIYLRVAVNMGSDTNPVWKLTARGEKVSEFNLPSEIGRAYSPEFNVTPDGQFYEIAHGDSGVFLLKFGSDGKFLTHTRIDAPRDFDPGPFAVFSTGQLLLSGAQRRDKDEWFEMIGLYGADGQLIRWLNFSSPGQQERPIPLGPVELQAAMGNDGNIYLLRGTQVFVMAPSGEIERRLSIEKPATHYYVGRIDISGGLLSVTFKEVLKGNKIGLRFRVFDTSTGEVLADYVPQPDLGNVQICYSSNEGYLFWKVIEGRPQLVRAQPK